jgi:hypothetical protein
MKSWRAASASPTSVPLLKSDKANGTRLFTLPSGLAASLLAPPEWRGGESRGTAAPPWPRRHRRPASRLPPHHCDT